MKKRLFPLLIVVLLIAVSAVSTTVILAGDGDGKLETKIASLVEIGELTQDQADAKLAAIQSGVSYSDAWKNQKTSFSADDLQGKLAALVESGELTQEQADAKLQWLESKTAAKD